MTGLLAAQEVQPHTYGTSAVSYVRVPGVALFPDNSAFGNFCPDGPLTRGQMAVFLSKALGLQFP
jgi:hypothetical protein